jgi:hypothetical protein
MAALPDTSALLADRSRGNPDALNQLLPLVYAELSHIALQVPRRLPTFHPGLSAIVETRAFPGATIEEAADGLGVSPPAAKREMRTTHAWLVHELGRGRPS